MSAGLYEQLKDDLGYLALGRAAECFAVLAEQARREEWSHVQFLSRVMAEQVAATTNRRLAARLRYARFPYRRTVDDFDFEFQPTVDRKLVEDLATLRFIGENRCLVFLGQPGCGKTHLAVALATKAVEAGYRGYFTTADDMAHALVAARRDGTFAAKLRTYTAPTVLVLDDVGLLPVPPGGAAEIFHVINTRYGRGHPTLVTTNRGLPDWRKVFGDGVVAPVLLSSTDSCTVRWCSTSRARAGGCASTMRWRWRPLPNRATSPPGGGEQGSGSWGKMRCARLSLSVAGAARRHPP